MGPLLIRNFLYNIRLYFNFKWLKVQIIVRFYLLYLLAIPINAFYQLHYTSLVMVGYIQ